MKIAIKTVFSRPLFTYSLEFNEYLYMYCKYHTHIQLRPSYFCSCGDVRSDVTVPLIGGLITFLPGSCPIGRAPRWRFITFWLLGRAPTDVPLEHPCLFQDVTLGRRDPWTFTSDVTLEHCSGRDPSFLLWSWPSNIPGLSLWSWPLCFILWTWPTIIPWLSLWSWPLNIDSGRDPLTFLAYPFGRDPYVFF